MNSLSSYFASQAVKGAYMHFVQKLAEGFIGDMRVLVIGSTTRSDLKRKVVLIRVVESPKGESAAQS